MLAVDYPDIREETTTVRFMPQGIRQNTKYDLIATGVEFYRALITAAKMHAELHYLSSQDATIPTTQAPSVTESGPSSQSGLC